MVNFLVANCIIQVDNILSVWKYENVFRFPATTSAITYKIQGTEVNAMVLFM
jgi:hypothetical protein